MDWRVNNCDGKKKLLDDCAGSKVNSDSKSLEVAGESKQSKFSTFASGCTKSLFFSSGETIPSSNSNKLEDQKN